MADELGRVQLEVGVDLATLQAQLQQVRTEVEKLPDISLGLKIDTQGISNQLNTISRQFLKRADYKIGVSYTSLTNAAQAAQQLKADLDALNARKDNVAIELNLDTLNRQVSSVDALLEDLRDARPIQLKIDTGLIDDAASAVDRVLEQLRETRPILLRADTGNVEETVQAAVKQINTLRTLPPVELRFDPGAVASAVDSVNDAINAISKQEPIRLPIDANLEPARTELAAFRKAAGVPIPVVLDLQVGSAKQEADALSRNLTGTAAQLPVDLLVDAARSELNQLRTEVGRPATIPLTADAAKANSVLAAFRKAAASALQIPLSAVTQQAEKAVQALRGKLSDPLPLEVTADTSDATTKLDLLQKQLSELVAQTYKVQVKVEQTSISPEEIQRQINEIVANGMSGEAARGLANIGGIEQVSTTSALAKTLRDELFQRINAERRTGQQGDTAFGRKGFLQFLETTGGLPEGITAKSTRPELQAASRERLQGLPDQQLLDLAQTLRDINAKLGPIGGSGAAGAGGGQPQRSFLDQIARMMLMMAGLDDSAIRQQIQQQRQPRQSGVSDPWNYTGGPLPFSPALRPEGTPLLTGISPVERTLLRDPALRDPRRLLAPDGGLDQPRRFAERIRANEQRNAARFQEQRLASDLANNASRSRRLLPSGLDRDLQEVLRNAANAFVDQIRRQLNAAIRQVEVKDLGTSPQPSLGGFAGPAGLLPDSTAAGAAAEQFRRDRTQAARARSAAREQALRDVPLLPPAIGNFDTRRREDTVRRAQELVDRGQLQPRRGETPVRALQRTETARNAAQFRLAQRRFEADQRDAQRAEQQRRQEQALVERERQAQQRQAAARRGARVQRRNDVISNALIGGAFPALFGQGLGASAGGLVGGGVGALAGPGFGFGGSLIGTAGGAAFDQALQSLKSLSAGLSDPIKAFQELQQAALFSSRAVEKNVESLIQAGRVEEAAARTRLDILQNFGNIDTLANDTDRAKRALAEFGVTIGQLAVGPLRELSGIFDGFLRIISTVPRGLFKQITGRELLPDNRATPEQLAQQEQAIRDARVRSKQLFDSSKELAQLGGLPDTPANRERAFALQLEQSRQRQTAALNAADPENDVLRREIRQQSKLERETIKAAREQFRRESRLALEDATTTGARQSEDAQLDLNRARATRNLFRPGQEGSRLAAESPFNIAPLRNARDRAIADLERGFERNADPAELEKLRANVDTTSKQLEAGLIKEADSLASAFRALKEQTVGLQRGLEDARTGQAVREGTDSGVNKFITDPKVVADREARAGRQLFAETQKELDLLGKKEGRPITLTFTGTQAEQNAQRAEFIDRARAERRADEDIPKMMEQLAAQTESLVKVNEALTGINEELKGATLELKDATNNLAGKNWAVYVSLDGAKVSGDAYRASALATSP